jgi:hypothetical protein
MPIPLIAPGFPGERWADSTQSNVGILSCGHDKIQICLWKEGCAGDARGTIFSARTHPS